MISNVSHTRKSVSHEEVGSVKDEAQPSFVFNQPRGVLKSDGTLFQVFAIASQTNDNFWRNLKQKFTKLYDD